MKSNTQFPLLTFSELSSLRQQAEQLKSVAASSQKLDSRNAGWLPTSALGSGMDYAESRVYQQGDDPRSINWRLSARSTETYVKNYHMESRPKICIVLDQRRSMIFGTRTRLKISQALRLACLLSYVAEQHHIEVQYLILKDKLQWLENQSVEVFLQQTNHAELPQTIETNKQASFEEALHQLSHFNRLKSGSLVYLISDFIDLETEHKNLLAQLQEHCFLQALQVVDSTEKSLLTSTNKQREIRLAQNGNRIKRASEQRETTLERSDDDPIGCVKRIKQGEVCFDSAQQNYINKHFQDMDSDAHLSINNASQQRLQKLVDQHFKGITQIFSNAAIELAEIMVDEEHIHAHLSLPLRRD